MGVLGALGLVALGAAPVGHAAEGLVTAAAVLLQQVMPVRGGPGQEDRAPPAGERATEGRGQGKRHRRHLEAEAKAEQVQQRAGHGGGPPRRPVRQA